MNNSDKDTPSNEPREQQNQRVIIMPRISEETGEYVRSRLGNVDPNCRISKMLENPETSVAFDETIYPIAPWIRNSRIGRTVFRFREEEETIKDSTSMSPFPSTRLEEQVQDSVLAISEMNLVYPDHRIWCIEYARFIASLIDQIVAQEELITLEFARSVRTLLYTLSTKGFIEGAMDELRPQSYYSIFSTPPELANLFGSALSSNTKTMPLGELIIRCRHALLRIANILEKY